MGKFDSIKLKHLPQVVEALRTLKYDADGKEFEDAVLDFVTEIDAMMEDWSFTAKLFLHLQAEFDKLEKNDAESWGKQTTQGFLRILTKLDDLGPEGETARAHFSKFSSIAEMARHFVITEEG